MKSSTKLAVCLLAALSAGAQGPRTFSVRGDIEGYSPGEVLFVELRPVTTAAAIRRELAGNDGSFEFRDIEAGSYEASALDSRGTPVRREVVHLDSFSNRFTIQNAAPARSVSL